jgi:hypothetical protein
VLSCEFHLHKFTERTKVIEAMLESQVNALDLEETFTVDEFGDMVKKQSAEIRKELSGHKHAAELEIIKAEVPLWVSRFLTQTSNHSYRVTLKIVGNCENSDTNNKLFKIQPVIKSVIVNRLPLRDEILINCLRVGHTYLTHSYLCAMKLHQSAIFATFV